MPPTLIFTNPLIGFISHRLALVQICICSKPTYVTRLPLAPSSPSAVVDCRSTPQSVGGIHNFPAGTEPPSVDSVSLGDPAMLGKHAILGEHAMSGKTAMSGKQALSGEHAPLLGEQAASLSPGESSLTPGASRGALPAGLPYIHLCPVACSASFQAYHQAHGIKATVYTAHSSTPLELIPTPSAISPTVDYSAAPDVDPHLFSCTFHASVAATLSPGAPPAADNKTDILTQSQMLKTDDRARFISCQKDEMKALYDLEIMLYQTIVLIAPKLM